MSTEAWKMTLSRIWHLILVCWTTLQNLSWITSQYKKSNDDYNLKNGDDTEAIMFRTEKLEKNNANDCGPQIKSKQKGAIL